MVTSLSCRRARRGSGWRRADGAVRRPDRLRIRRLADAASWAAVLNDSTSARSGAAIASARATCRCRTPVETWKAKNNAQIRQRAAGHDADQRPSSHEDHLGDDQGEADASSAGSPVRRCRVSPARGSEAHRRRRAHRRADPHRRARRRPGCLARRARAPVAPHVDELPLGDNVVCVHPRARSSPVGRSTVAAVHGTRPTSLTRLSLPMTETAGDSLLLLRFVCRCPGGWQEHAG